MQLAATLKQAEVRIKVRSRSMCVVTCSTKFAVEGLSEALALAVPKTGVLVTRVEPGATRTATLQRAVQLLEDVQHGNLRA